jgi:hypothetical protein
MKKLKETLALVAWVMYIITMLCASILSVLYFDILLTQK